MKISRNIPIFLIATILLFGTTISIGIPASYSQPEYKGYEESYGKDHDKSTGLNKQNVNCNNIIINGLDSGGQGSGGDMLGGMTNAEDGTGQWLGNGEKKDLNNINENIVNFCKNKHTKVVVEPPTGSLTVKKDIFGCNIFTDPFDLQMICQTLDPSSDEWLSCDHPNDFDNPIFCNVLQKSFFDIQVLDEQDNIVQKFTGEEGTTITNIEPGTKYTVEEIKYPASTEFDQLQEDADSESSCVTVGFADGGFLDTTGVTYLDLCFEYEDEQGNDCSTTTIAAGEDKTCIVKNYIRFGTTI